MAKEAGKLLLRDGRSGPQNGVPEGCVSRAGQSPGADGPMFPSTLPHPSTLDVSDHTFLRKWSKRFCNARQLCHSEMALATGVLPACRWLACSQVEVRSLHSHHSVCTFSLE